MAALEQLLDCVKTAEKQKKPIPMQLAIEAEVAPLLREVNKILRNQIVFVDSKFSEEGTTPPRQQFHKKENFKWVLQLRPKVSQSWEQGKTTCLEWTHTKLLDTTEVERVVKQPQCGL